MCTGNFYKFLGQYVRSSSFRQTTAYKMYLFVDGCESPGFCLFRNRSFLAVSRKNWWEAVSAFDIQRNNCVVYLFTIRKLGRNEIHVYVHASVVLI